MRMFGKISKMTSRLAAVDIILAASIAIFVVSISPSRVGAAVHDTLFKISVEH